MALPFFLLGDPGPSRFWSDVDALCTDAAAIAVIEPEKLDGKIAERDELFAYCRFSKPPRFAARPEAERAAKLAAFYRALGKTPPATPPTVDLAAAAKAANVAANEALDATTEDAELGLAGERMLSFVLGEVCSQQVQRVLPTSCQAKGLRDLRRALLADLTATVLLVAKDLTGGAALEASAIFAAVYDHSDPIRAAERLAGRLPSGADACASSRDRAACEFTATALRVLVQATVRIARDGTKLDRDPEHYQNVIEEVLRDEAKKPDLAAGPTVRAATTQLVESLRTYQALERVSSAAVSDRDRASLDVLRKALVVGALGAAAIQGVDAGAKAQGFIEAGSKAMEAATQLLNLLARGKPRDFFGGIQPLLTAAEARGVISNVEVRALGAAASLSAARSVDDVKRVARDAVITLPPWVDRLIFDINLAPPSFQDAHGKENVSLNGDVTVGYNGEVIGFSAHADTAYYDITADQNSSLTERYVGRFDLWGLIAVSPTVAIEPRLALGGAYYGTLADDFVGGIDRQTNQDSIMGRGSALVGLRLRPHPRVGIAFSGGGGVQYEDYYRVLQTSLGDQGTTFNVALSAKVEGHLRFQWAIVPQIVSFRARADYTRFQMRRDDQAVTVSLGEVTQASQGVIEIEQNEFFARGFIDADVARFFGFVPAIHAGVNVFVLDGNGQSVANTVPVFGIGIRREAL